MSLKVTPGELHGYEAGFFEMMARTRLLGPGCGYAEFEADDWREQAALRMSLGLRPGLVSRYRVWQAARATEGC